MDPDFIAPVKALTIVVVALLLGLGWFNWRDRRDAKRKARPDSK